MSRRNTLVILQELALTIVGVNSLSGREGPDPAADTGPVVDSATAAAPLMSVPSGDTVRPHAYERAPLPG